MKTIRCTSKAAFGWAWEHSTWCVKNICLSLYVFYLLKAMCDRVKDAYLTGITDIAVIIRLFLFIHLFWGKKRCQALVVLMDLISIEFL